MKKNFMQFVLCLLATAVLFQGGSAMAAGGESNPTIRVGLWYGGNALPSANLENSVGTGYRFGYFDESLTFWPVGFTGEGKISILKTKNMYLAGDVYTDAQILGDAIGCYHLQSSTVYSSFEEAQNAATGVSGGFPAWLEGAYYVRAGAYLSNSDAQVAQATLPNFSVVTSSANGVSVVKTGTSSILFQFDGGVNMSLAIQPGIDDVVQAVTWFKGFKYYGGFQYQRLAGGNLTVSNIVSIEDYIKGVVPYEMSPTWPLEALKAQAVCARNYAIMQYRTAKHTKLGFDICNTVCCQVYQGLNKASELTDRAVIETAGKFAWYNGVQAELYYASSDGGATEDVGNVWQENANLGHLKGVVDSYESTIADSIPNYRWSVTFTRQQLTDLLNSKGYTNSGIVNFYISEVTSMGNVRSITFVDSAGKTRTFSKEIARTLLGLRSLRYTVTNGNSGAVMGTAIGVESAVVPMPSNTRTYYVDGGQVLSTVSGAYAIDGSDNLNVVGGTPYAITGDGLELLSPSTGGSVPTPIPTPGPSVGGDVFTISGTGNGHNVGMSQYGANAMAKAGKGFEEILKFYFTGIEIR